jgi:hypothetical protein
MEVITMEENNEVNEIQELSLNKKLVLDSHLICGLILVDDELIENPEKFGMKQYSIEDFNVELNDKGKIEYYYINKEDKTMYRKEYFEHYKYFEKIFGNQLLFCYKKNYPLIITLKDTKDEYTKDGVISYCIAQRFQGD